VKKNRIRQKTGKKKRGGNLMGIWTPKKLTFWGGSGPVAEFEKGNLEEGKGARTLFTNDFFIMTGHKKECRSWEREKEAQSRGDKGRRGAAHDWRGGDRRFGLSGGRNPGKAGKKRPPYRGEKVSRGSSFKRSKVEGEGQKGSLLKKEEMGETGGVSKVRVEESLLPEYGKGPEPRGLQNQKELYQKRDKAVRTVSVREGVGEGEGGNRGVVEKENCGKF